MAATESAWRRNAKPGTHSLNRHRKQAQDDDSGAPDIGAEVESVSLKSLAVIFLRCPVKHAGTGDIDPDRGDHDSERPEGDLHINRVKQKTVGGLVNDPDTGGQKEEGFKEAGEIFHLAVAIKVILIRRLAGNSDGQKGHHRSHEIEAGMGGLGKNAQDCPWRSPR